MPPHMAVFVQLTCSTHLLGFPNSQAQPYRIVQEGGREPGGNLQREGSPETVCLHMSAQQLQEGEPASAEQDIVNCPII